MTGPEKMDKLFISFALAAMRLAPHAFRSIL